MENPIFWLKKFAQRGLSKKNQEDWIKAIQLNTDSELEKNIISYLKWNLKKNEFLDLPCYSNLATQNDFRHQIRKAAQKGHISTVKMLAPLTKNPNAKRYGKTPIHFASDKGHTEIVKILTPLGDNVNAPDKEGETPIYRAARNCQNIGPFDRQS